MKLQISAGKKVKSLKQQFSEFFPFLKIEVFNHPHEKEQGSGLEQKARDRLLLCEVTGALVEGVMLIDPLMTVGEFEQVMQKKHGLPVQVFRKSGDLWIETIQTDNMTLKAQNSLGQESVQGNKSHFNANTLFL